MKCSVIFSRGELCFLDVRSFRQSRGLTGTLRDMIPIFLSFLETRNMELRYFDSGVLSAFQRSTSSGEYASLFRTQVGLVLKAFREYMMLVMDTELMDS